MTMRCGRPLDARSPLGWAAVEWTRKEWQDWYVHRARESHQRGGGVPERSSRRVASSSSIMPRMASSSPSGAEPVPTWARGEGKGNGQGVAPW